MTASTEPARQPSHLAGSALLVGLAVFGLLWFVGMAYRQVYVARVDDITALADGLLLVPGARWEDWFTQGHSHFFDAYPEWPWGLAPFARPAFQFLIYLAHFVFERDWSSYLSINYLGIAGVAAAAFAIARRALGLGSGASVLAAALIVLSPAVLEYSIWQLGFASEPLASVLVGCAFLAVVARRDLLCLVLLLVALLTKETAVWAPFAAALTVLLRPGSGEAVYRRVAVAAAMLVPVALWLALRFAYYGGIGGSYATASYWPFMGFLKLTIWKLTHLDRLFVMQDISLTEGRSALVDRLFRIATALLVVVLLVSWALSGLRATMDRLGRAVRDRRWPTADPPFLVTLWAVLGLAFHVTIAVANPVYAAAAVMLAWPAMVGEAVNRNALVRAALAVCSILSLAQTTHFLVGISLPPLHEYMSANYRAAGEMNALLSYTPTSVRQIFVVSSARDLAPANPAHLRAFLDLSADIVHVIDIDWSCTGSRERVAYEHAATDGVVTLSAVLPDCASFEFSHAEIAGDALTGSRIRRNGSISYELPEARPIEREHPWDPALDLGRRMTAQIRPQGPARFIIERGGSDGGLAWFDTP